MLPRCALLVAIVTSAAGCGVTTLEPPGVPEADVPDFVESMPGEPGPDQGRLSITTDVAASVRLERPGPAGPRGRLVCRATPCVITLPYGEHSLVFEGRRDKGRESRATVTMGDRDVILNHTLGQERVSVGFVAGSAIAVAGAATVLVAGKLLADDGTSPDSASSLAYTGLGGVAALLVGGLFMLLSPRPVSQPGASREWTLRTARGRPGIRF